MNSLIKIIKFLLESVSGFLSSVDRKTAALIRQFFFMILFVLCMIGIYIGYSSGREAAQIKSPPIAEYTRDLFQLDRKREREEARFGSMLESQKLNEMKYRERAKIPFPNRYEMSPEKREGIMEPDSSIRQRRGPETYEGRSIVEGNYTGKERTKADVSPLQKKLKPLEADIINQKERETPVKSLESEKRKRKMRDQREKPADTPSPIKKDQGIIEK